MKKIAALLLIAAALFLCCRCTNNQPDGGAPASAGDTAFESPPETVLTGGDEKVSYSLAGNKLTVTLDLPESALKPVSLLLLTDKERADDYPDKPESLIDIDEVTPDRDGKAEVVMTLDAERQTAYLIVTTSDSTYEWRIKS